MVLVPVRPRLVVCLASLVLMGCANPTASVRDRLREVSAAFPGRTSSPALADAKDRGGSPGNLSLSNSRLKVEHLEIQVQEALRTHNTEAAAQLCDEILELDSRSVFAHHHLAVFADQQGLYAEAEQHYLAALDTDPRNADVLSSLGWSYLLQGRSSEALQMLQQALQHHPGHPTAVFNLGWLAGLQGDESRALAYFRRQATEVEAEQLLQKVRTEARQRHLHETAVADLQAPNPRLARGAIPPVGESDRPQPRSVPQTPPADDLPLNSQPTDNPQVQLAAATTRSRPASAPVAMIGEEVNPPPESPVHPTNSAEELSFDEDLPAEPAVLVSATAPAPRSLTPTKPDSAPVTARSKARAPLVVTPADWQAAPDAPLEAAVELVENTAASADNPESVDPTPSVAHIAPAIPQLPGEPAASTENRLNANREAPVTARPMSSPHAARNGAGLAPELTVNDLWQIGRALLGPGGQAAPSAETPSPPATSQSHVVARRDGPAPIPSAAHRRALQRGLDLGLPALPGR